MKRYLKILLIAAAAIAVSCASYEEGYDPSLESSSSSSSSSQAIHFDNGEIGVYLNMAARTTENIDVTRSAATGTEAVLADGWAFVFGAALPSVFDETNTNGYGHSSPLLEMTDITINSNGVAFFRFDQYPWVQEAGYIDYLKYTAIVGLNFYVDDNGYPICTDGTANYYYHVDDKKYYQQCYDEEGNIEYMTDGTSYSVDENIDIVDDSSWGATNSRVIDEKLYLIYCYIDDGVYHGFTVNREHIDDGDFKIGQKTSYGEDVEGLMSQLLNFDEGYATKYVYDEDYYKYLDKTNGSDYPFKGINHMCFIRFMVNLTEGTTAEINEFVAQRMINEGTKSGDVTTFEEYKHLSVGLDAYYSSINIDESNGAEATSPTPQSDGHAGLLAEKYPMASPGMEMTNGLNEYTLYGLNEEDVIALVQVGSKVDVTTTDSDFTLIGVTLHNGAKRALMRSSVLDNDGITADYTLSLPTNLHYRYGQTDENYTRVGTITYNEVLAPDYITTADYPIYFFPNEGDYPEETDEGSQYDYSLPLSYEDSDTITRTLNEDFTNISDPVNGHNPTYLIVRGFVAQYHDRDGDGVYDPIASDGTQTDDYGYYKIPIKYVSYSDGSTTLYTYDIYRCNYFQVTLTSMNNAGYKTYEEAVAGPASDVYYDIIIGGDSDARNEYATSNGTFYVETDVTDFYIMGYGTDGFDEATFNVTVVDNESYSSLNEKLLTTKAEEDEEAEEVTLYGTPTLCLTMPAGVYVLRLEGDDDDESTEDIVIEFEEPTSKSSTTNVYEVDVVSGTKYKVTFHVTSDASSDTTLEGAIAVQAGDVCQLINIFYDDLGYLSAGDYSYVGTTTTTSSGNGNGPGNQVTTTTTYSYERNDTVDEDDQNEYNTTDGFNVNGEVAFTACNSLVFDKEFYAGDSYWRSYDYVKDGETTISNPFTSAADANAFGQFISEDGYVDCNKYGYTNSYGYTTNVFLNRECRATAYRTEGKGIAKIYINQASDFGLLVGDGTDFDMAASSEYTIAYTSRGYIYSLIYSDDGYGAYDADNTAISTGSNTPLSFYVAGDERETSLVTVKTNKNYGVNSVTNGISLYDGTTAVSGFCSGGMPAYLEDDEDYDREQYQWYTAETTTDDRDEIETSEMSTDIHSWNSAQTTDAFNIWAYPILRNQGSDFDYKGEDEDEDLEWTYNADGETAYLDEAVTVTLTNIAGEVKEYVFNLAQYALPFWDPTLTITGTGTGSYINCNFYADAGTTNSNYSNSNGSDTLDDDDISTYMSDYTSRTKSQANEATYISSRAIGAVVVYNCYYNNGDDFSWPYNDNVSGVVNVQAYDLMEPEYVVFGVFTNNTATGTTNTGTAYFQLLMRNAANEETYLRILINRDDSYVENLKDGDYYYFDFLPLQESGGSTVVNGVTITNQRQVAAHYDTILDFLSDPAYTSTINGGK